MSDVEEYGFFGINSTGQVNNVETLWNGTKIQPALNISAFYVPELSSVYDDFQNWTELVRGPRSNNPGIFYTAVGSNITYSNEYVMENGRCQTREVGVPRQCWIIHLTSRQDFQWGFSFLQLFIDIIFLLVWITGTWVLWLKAHKELKRRDGVEVSARYRAVLDLAAAIAKDPDTATLTSGQLAKHIQKQLRGGSIAAENPILLSKYRFRDNLWPWIKSHAWWILLLLCIGPSGPLIPAFIAAIAVAILVGRTTASRVLLFLCGFLIIFAVAFPTIVTITTYE